MIDNLIFHLTSDLWKHAAKMEFDIQADARFLTLPSIDFNTLTSILLIKAAFLLGLFLKDYLFEEPLEVDAVPIGPSYIKPNTYSAPQSYSRFSSKSDPSLPSFENLSSQTLSVIPEKSYSHSSLNSKVSPTYRHIPLRRKHQIAKKRR